MRIFRRKPSAPDPPVIDPLAAVDAGRVTRIAREWTKELGGFQSPQADAALLGMCVSATAVSAALAEKRGENKLDAQMRCICQGLKVRNPEQSSR